MSRVLNGHGKKNRISQATQELVLRTANELGYMPDQLARGLRLKRSHTIGLIIPDISNPFFSTLARSIENEARKSGYSIILSDTQEETQLEIDSVRLLQGRKVDGFIICPTGNESAHLEVLIQTGLPIVIADRHFPDLKCPYVISDNYHGSFDAVSHLIEKNHKTIACIQGRPKTSVNDNRVRGFRDAMIKYNLIPDETLLVGDSFGQRNGYVSAKLLLSRNPRPTAFFACSNLISLGAMRAIYEEGLKIPDDISMISFDDQPYSEYLATPMSVVVQQTKEMGQIIFKLLMARINQGSPVNSGGVVLPTKLILRRSVKDLKIIRTNTLTDDDKQLPKQEIMRT